MSSLLKLKSVLEEKTNYTFLYSPYYLDDPENHSMTDSLYRYLDIKMHECIREDRFKNILVIGEYDRSCHISRSEKNNKKFNFHRPTAKVIADDTIIIKCYPSQNYVKHYASLIKTYCVLDNLQKNVQYALPTEEKCWETLLRSNIDDVPVSDVAIIGSGLDKLTNKPWTFGSPFLWAEDKLKNMSTTFIGCQHSYWSDAGGRLVSYLGYKGFKRVIYVGKLGCFKPEIAPNNYLATGNLSIVEDETVTWDNVFENVKFDNLIHGTHSCCPGVIMETKEWVERHKNYDFVDPEIGQMAKFAVSSGVEFSYLHLVSDNVSKKYDEDLSNEREFKTIKQRKNILDLKKRILYEME